MPPLKLTSGDLPDTNEIEQLDHNEFHKYLGNHLTASMDMQESFDTLLKKSNNFACRLTSSDLSKYDAWIAYHAIYVSSLRSPLPVTHHSQKRLLKLQSKAICATLAKIEIN